MFTNLSWRTHLSEAAFCEHFQVEARTKALCKSFGKASKEDFLLRQESEARQHGIFEPVLSKAWIHFQK